MGGRIIGQARQPRLVLPRIGKIKVGMKNEKGYPQSVDYFIPTGKYAGLFTQAYGERPQTIQIIFPSDDAEQVCCEQYEYRTDKGELVASGDGKEFSVWNGKEYITLSTDDYPNLMKSIETRYPNKLLERTGEGWRVRLTVNFIIPLVRGVAGIWTFESNGTASTIPNVRDCFDGMLEKRGFVKGVLFDLNVKYATSQKPNDKSRYPVVTLVANESEGNVLKVKKALENPMKVLENKK